MARLFIRFYVSILLVLFAAWIIHGIVWQWRKNSDMSRVIEIAHGGGARLVVRELNSVPLAARANALKRLQEGFPYSVAILSTEDLPEPARNKLAGGNDIAHANWGKRHGIAAGLDDGNVVHLGPFPDYFLKEVENSVRGWARLIGDAIDDLPAQERGNYIADIQSQFDYPVAIVRTDELPKGPFARIMSGEDLVFYSENEIGSFAATTLSDGTEVVRFGPFPQFVAVETSAATTTLGLILLPAALAIALLLRPVTKQLHHVEDAAKSIAAGDLGARVDERNFKAAKPLAQSFNNMADRTETLVRTQRELLQAVSHDLRTPLARMRFAIELVESAKDDAERKQRLDALDAATEELDGLVGELLSYVRMETTEPRIEREPIGLQEELSDLIPKHASMHPSVSFTTGNSIDAQDTVMADRGGLQRVLGNLLSNAGRFAAKSVMIHAESTADATIIDVDDDGTGIPADERKRVMEPFVRLENGVNGHGVGLGLALVNRIVTQHGGTVDIQTSPLGGCRIRTIWPN